MTYQPPRLNEQLFFRCTSEDRAKVERAAEIRQQRLSDFARDAVLAVAERIIAKEETKQATLLGEVAE